MKFAMFYHSLISDWNHADAHFLRGVATELLARGHEVRIFEPKDGWSYQNLVREQGDAALAGFRSCYPQLRSIRYRMPTLDLEEELEGVEVVIVHEWTDRKIVWRLARLRACGAPFRLLFHDTHHRSVTERQSLPLRALAYYDGVLAFGRVLRDLYLSKGWARRAWTWHEAADTRVFHPIQRQEPEGDLVWIGNWCDGERDAELREFLLRPAKKLHLRARAYGVGYPAQTLAELRQAGIGYGGWLPNYRAPEIFARFRVTIHVPRRPYVRALPGIPTIRVFEALACGIPLICAPWDDAEGLFTPGDDYLVARDGTEMTKFLDGLLRHEDLARELAANGRRTILARHTCAHRVSELLSICAGLGVSERGETRSEAVCAAKC